MNSTTKSGRLHIGIFGKSNVGKSSLFNKITNKDLSIVSNKKGTTTDPIHKSMEITNIGACTLFDTPGFDDLKTKLGKLRVKKTLEILNVVDAIIFVVENGKTLNIFELEFLEKIKLKKIPLIVVINEFEKQKENYRKIYYEKNFNKTPKIKLNVKNEENIENLIVLMQKHFVEQEKEKHMLSDLLNADDVVLLVVAIDISYPKNRIILPQQQLLNELLQKGVVCYICRNFEYETFLKKINIKPKIIVTDSQIFSEIFKKTPKNFLITSFSILLARKNNILKTSITGVSVLKKIKSKNKILICESCTHKKNSCDVGSVKIPKWIENYTKEKPKFEFEKSCFFSKNIKQYSLVIHCGGCMITKKQIQNKFEICKKNNVPITNYGILIAFLNNVLEKSLLFLKKLKK